MLLRQSSTAAGSVVTRAFVCSVSRHSVFTCIPLTRFSERSCAPSTQARIIHTGSTRHCRRYWWHRQDQDLARTSQRHRLSTSLIGNSATCWNARNTVVTSEQRRSYVTSTPGGLEEPDAEDKDEVDLRALTELEIELYRQEGSPMPSVISERHWEDLLTKKTVSSRKKYLTFLFKNEMRNVNKLKQKERKKEEREEERRQIIERLSDEDSHIEYGLWRNSIFPKILETTMNHFYHCGVIQAMLFGQPIVIDLDFEEHMNVRERQNCAYQIQLMISDNRKHVDPYSIEVCNAPPTLDLMARLERYIPIMHKPEYPVMFNSESYLKKFPKERLVYLTPHCQEEMKVYDHNAVYIIGGIVDKSSGEPLSFAKAKREGIRMQKLPLERYLSWGIGNKCLTLNQIMSIMLDFKVSGDWSYALRHVPRRKLQYQPSDQQRKEEKLLKRIKNKRSSRDY